MVFELLLLLLTSVSASSEWVGRLTVLNSSNEYHNVSLVHDSPMSMRAYFSLVYTNETLNESASTLPMLLLGEVNNDTSLEAMLDVCQSLSANFTLLITDQNVTYEQVKDANVSVFTIAESEGKRLKEEIAANSDPATVYLQYYFNFDCQLITLLVRMYAGSTIAWMLFLIVWVCNNSYWNARHVNMMQKILTLILVFKTLGVYASFSLYMSCPFDRVSYGLLQLVQNQFRTLYETSYLCLLLVLCKGFSLIRSEFTRQEFNHISILASIIYVTVSAYNIMGNQISLMIFLMYFALWAHCSVFSYTSLRVIKERIRLAESTQVTDMNRAWLLKRRMFIALVTASQLYFLGELLIHLVVTDWSFGLLANVYDVGAVNVGVHEGLEVIVLGMIFFVYRAKSQGRFFSLLNDGGAFPRLTLIYRTNLFASASQVSSDLPANTPVAILNPGSDWDSNYPFERVTMALISRSAASSLNPRKKSVRDVEMSEHVCA